MNLMVSVGVTMVVPSMTRIASFCTLSSCNQQSDRLCGVHVTSNGTGCVHFL